MTGIVMHPCIRRLLSCDHDPEHELTLAFSIGLRRHWANLCWWEGITLHTKLPCLRDSDYEIRLIATKPFVKLMVISEKICDTHVGEYVDSRTRTTTDPLELHALLSHTASARALACELMQIFPAQCNVRKEQCACG